MRLTTGIAVVLVLTSTTLGMESAEKYYRASGIQGGLVVHLQCGDGTLTADLGKHDAYLVQGLDTRPENVAKARQHIRSQGLYGKVSVIHLDSTTLPYNSNLVNLIVGHKPPNITEQEIRRVLAPRGEAHLKQGIDYKLLKKELPTDTDDWTHYLHGSDNNAVSQDRVVSHPYHIQWVGLPTWTRHHNYLNSYSALVSSKGRIFYILDEGPRQSIHYASRWSLVARDAYNGVILWKKAIGQWEAHLRPFRSGPNELPRRLVAVGDRVYVTLGYREPLSILDAATGRLIIEVPGTEGTCEIIHAENTLFLVGGEIQEGNKEKGRYETGILTQFMHTKRIMAVDADTGDVLWTKRDEHTQEMLPTTLCANQTALYFHSPNHLMRLDPRTGKTAWKIQRPLDKNRLAWSAPTLVLYKDLVLCAEGKHGEDPKKSKKKKTPAPTPEISPGPSGVTWEVRPNPRSLTGGKLVVYSAQNGKKLWHCPAAFGYSSPPNLFVANGLVWVSTDPGINKPDMGEGRDPYTGEIKQTIDMTFTFDAAHHHRCYRDKATENFLLLGRTGVEFVNLKDKAVQRHYWIRGTCQYGLMPANGLLYLPGHSCGCYIQSKLNGFWTLAPQQYDDTPDDSNRLIKGPAYEPHPSSLSLALRPLHSSEDWPTLRHDVQRSNLSTTSLSGAPQLQWRAKLDDHDGLTSPVIAGNRLVCARKDQHQILCLDTDNGAVLWQFTTGGRIDSPPTLYRGRVLVGAHDGHVYCLTLADGKLAWRFRAAPRMRQTVAHAQVESVWPVVGSVLVHNDRLYCTAGRSSYIDGGITLFVLDPTSGREITRNQFYSRDTQTGEQPDALLEDVELPGTLPDILTVQGDGIFLRDKKLNDMGQEIQPGLYEPHLYSSAGLLNDEWWHRTIWIWGKRAFGRASGWALAGRYNPSGRFLVLDGPTVYGYKYTEGVKESHELFSASKKVEKVNRPLKNNNSAVVKYVTPDKTVYHWRQELDMAVRAMLLTEDHLYAAGPAAQGVILFNTAKSPATISVYSRQDGARISNTRLPAQPIFDGMAAANGRLFVTLVNGEIACYK